MSSFPEPTLRSNDGWTVVSLRLIEPCEVGSAYVAIRVQSEMWRPPGIEQLDVVRDLTFRVPLSLAAMQAWEAAAREVSDLLRDDLDLDLGRTPGDTVTFKLRAGGIPGRSEVRMVIENHRVRTRLRFTTDVTCLGQFATEMGQLNARLQAMRGP